MIELKSALFRHIVAPVAMLPLASLLLPVPSMPPLPSSSLLPWLATLCTRGLRGAEEKMVRRGEEVGPPTLPPGPWRQGV